MFTYQRSQITHKLKNFEIVANLFNWKYPFYVGNFK